MRKQDIAARLARKAHLSRAAAADRLDRIIHDILAELKRGKTVPLPGLGILTPGEPLDFKFDRQKGRGGVGRDRKR